MKELIIEQKAKAYDKAVKQLKDIFNCKEVKVEALERPYLERLFPELKESEDERIRKAITSVINFSDDSNMFYSKNNVTQEQCIVWLEKQSNIIEFYEDKLDRCACNYFNKGYKAAMEKQGEQKPVCGERDEKRIVSEEDEKIRKALVALVEWAECFSSSGIDSDTAKQMIGWIGVRDVEYTRTDAFIEKAWEWIEDNMLSSNQQDKSRLYFEQFKNYIKD